MVLVAVTSVPIGKCAVSKEIIYGKFIYQFNPIRSAGAVVVENEN